MTYHFHCRSAPEPSSLRAALWRCAGPVDSSPAVSPAGDLVLSSWVHHCVGSDGGRAAGVVFLVVTLSEILIASSGRLALGSRIMAGAFRGPVFWLPSQLFRRPGLLVIFPGRYLALFRGILRHVVSFELSPAPIAAAGLR